MTQACKRYNQLNVTAVESRRNRNRIIIKAADATSGFNGEVGLIAGGKSVHARPTVAVLPFVNITAIPKIDRLSDEFTDSFVDALTKTQAFGEVRRCFQPAQPSATVSFQGIGRRLNVDLLVIGSIRRSGELVRASVKLLHTQNGNPVRLRCLDSDASALSPSGRGIAGRLARHIAMSLTVAPQPQSAE